MTTVKTVIERAYRKVNGEFEELLESSDDFKTYLNLLNEVLEVWATWPYTRWQSLYNSNYRLPTQVSAGTLIYPIPQVDQDRIIIAHSPLDAVYLMNGDVQVKKYKMTDQAVFDSTNVPTVTELVSDGVHFKATPAEIVGCDIRLPVYMLPPQYTSGSQTVRIDSITWLVFYMAASICDASPVPFIARNADKYYKQAEIHMKSMKANNKHRQHMTIKRAGVAPGSPQYLRLSQAIDAGIGINGGSLTGVDGGTF